MSSACTENMGTQYPVCSDISQVASLLKEFGVCVIPDVFTSSECDAWMQDILSNMETLSGHQVNHEEPNSWAGDKLPPVVRYGLYQHVLNNLKAVWEIRRDPRWKNIFKTVYSELREEEVDEFVCSLDGINIQPNVQRDVSQVKDWPHCDQTRRDDIYKCVQGQVVLTNTQACFRATPKSHNHFIEIMEMCGIRDNNRNWAKFNDEQLGYIQRNTILPNELPFQIPVRSTKGSVILWFSTTIHSAMGSGIKETPTEEDPFKGWRGVVYVCYRPLSEFNTGELKVLEQCLENNKGTNHWATKVFTQQRGGQQRFSPAIQRLIENPQLAYQVLGFRPHPLSFLINETVEMETFEPTVQEQDNSGNGGSGSGDTVSGGTGGSRKKKSKGKGKVQGGWRR